MRSTLRLIVTGFAALLLAGGLSAGAALAEDLTTPDRPGASPRSHRAPTGVCLLARGTLRGDRP